MYLLNVYSGQSAIVGTVCNAQKKQDTPFLSRACNLVEGEMSSELGAQRPVNLRQGYKEEWEQTKGCERVQLHVGAPWKALKNGFHLNWDLEDKQDFER